MNSYAYIDNGSHFLKVEQSGSNQMFSKPVVTGSGQYTSTIHPQDREWDNNKHRLNIDLAYNDK